MDFKIRKKYMNMPNLTNMKYDIPVFFIGAPIKTGTNTNSQKKGFKTQNDGILSIADFKLKMNALLNGFSYDARELLGLEVKHSNNNILRTTFNYYNDTYEILKIIYKSFDNTSIDQI